MKKRFFLLTAAIICAGMLAQAQIKPTFNPVKGETYTYRTVANQKFNQSFSGQSMNVNSVIEFLTEMKIIEKTGNEVSVDYIYKEMVMELTNPMINIKVDTKNKDANASELDKLIGNIFDCFLGKTIQVTFLQDGSVKSITGHDVIMSDIQKILASANVIEKQMANAFLQSFGEEGIKSSFEQMFKIYPDKEIKNGGSWSKDLVLTLGAGMSSDVKNTYTLKSVSNDIALLDITSTLNMKMPGSEGGITGEQKGDMKLNVKTGMPVQSKSEGTAKGKMTAQGMEITIEMIVQTTSTLQ